ncbi:RdgB/HAM1 family non-canonical purine NTP pyrophosphatase [Fundidesulfovibrio butyratiphilus]
MIRVVLATRNQGKVRELRALTEGMGLDIVGLDAFPEVGEVEETGETFLENALLKARAVRQATGLLALADDSGLAVDALGGAPGVRSARFAGEKASDADNNAKLLSAMADVPDGKRTCRFVSVVAACAPDGRELVAEGAWEGAVARELKGQGGFGYDPLFVDTASGRTAAELTPEEKNARSHRGQALGRLLARWSEVLG